MKNTPSYWLLLEKSKETLVSSGIDLYGDETGVVYRYDSLVPNFKGLKSGDFVVLRKENQIVGTASVGAIYQEDAIKTHRRCPRLGCGTTDIRLRKTRLPKYRCGRRDCSNEFDTPLQTEEAVITFEAKIVNFSKLSNPPSVESVKACSTTDIGMKAQLSILKLDPVKLKKILDVPGTDLVNEKIVRNQYGQGFGLSSSERTVVELHAMDMARKYFEQSGWIVVDTSRTQSFDLLATRGKERRFVEVKGTTGDGGSILLTAGEVAHINANPEESAIVVVSEIKLTDKKTEPTATGGNIRIFDPAVLSPSSLEATVYRYKFTK